MHECRLCGSRNRDYKLGASVQHLRSVHSQVAAGLTTPELQQYIAPLEVNMALAAKIARDECFPGCFP